MECFKQTMTEIGEVDDDHQVLFELLNRSIRLAQDKGCPDLSAILDELLGYTIIIFDVKS